MYASYFHLVAILLLLILYFMLSQSVVKVLDGLVLSVYCHADFIYTNLILMYMKNHLSIEP